MAVLEPAVIERRKLFEQVAAHLERDILSGAIAPGEQLAPERELQQRFGVGRPAVREALISLQRVGLLEITNGMRARVSMPTPRFLFAGITSAVQHMLSLPEGRQHLQDARRFFEIGLARRAAMLANGKDITRLDAALHRNRVALGNRAAFIETDVAFHFEIAGICGNPVFPSLHEAMAGWLIDQRAVSLAQPGQEKRGYESHSRIFEAIARHDPDAAEKAMDDHLRQVAGAYWKANTDTKRVSHGRPTKVGGANKGSDDNGA